MYMWTVERVGISTHHRTGTNGCVDVRRPETNQHHFARVHKDRTLDQWEKVTWSDDSRLTLFLRQDMKGSA